MRSGRRPGKQDTRETILVAARASFASDGYDATTVRKLAAAVGVDPALVHHYFGSKEELFRSAVGAPVNPASLFPRIFVGPRSEIPERLVRTFLGVWDDPVTGPSFLAFLRTAVRNQTTNKLVREFFDLQVQRRVLRDLDTGIPAAEIPLRTTLLASHLFGLAMMRYLIQLEPLASASTDTVVAAVAPAVRHALYGPLGQASRVTSTVTPSVLEPAPE
ncbi:TetR/AcrR family transcriptional regulator [Tenggerimyces flavus]|uniref:TetR family transcriptional regulator n=1 Tax=Tenggerimyces flavus TaxID=1708749 RepID=A0ABV7YGW9_9ACTN|nr:TetR family transcriptional regulator [Tenggerimyces flavus]MBM7789263.1 AcrR family transcriptional regulator [Tenggerimyces flavus]